MANGAATPVPDSPLAVRDFRVYWIGQFISLVGMWMQMLAQGWVITRLTGSTATFGTISFVSSIPMALLSMPAGLLADRMERRRILIVTQVLLALISLLYGWLIWTDRLTLDWVYGLALVGGAIVAFDFPAQSALVPQLVPPRLIPKAIGLNQAIFHGSRLIGPAAAGLLIAATSPATAFLANAVSYLAVIYSLSIIPARPVVASGGRGGKGGGGMAEGFRYVRSEPVVGALIGLTALVTVFLMPIFAVLMPIVATKMFHADATEMGFVMGASGGGAVIGSLLLLRIPTRLRGRVIVIAAGLAGLGMIGLSFMTSPYAAAAVMMVFNANTALALGLSATTIQVLVPEHLRGRVMGLFGMTFIALMPPFALLWGYVADWTSLPTLVLVLGVGFLVTAQALLLATGVWKLGLGARQPARAAG